MRKLAILALLLTWNAARAEETAITAGELASWCQPYRTATVSNHNITVQATSESQVCYGAFLAIQQFAATTLGSDHASILKTCVAEKSGLLELIKVFLHYMDEHPERGHEKFTNVVLSSLWAAYPCRALAKPK